MLDPSVLRFVAVRLPWLFSGRTLHRMALGTCVAGAYAAADPLFDRAAERYLVDMEIEALARLRVHQLMARVRATREPLRDQALCLEVEQRLLRLEWIEALEPPFELVPGSRLLATWLIEQPDLSPVAHARGAAGPAA